MRRNDKEAEEDADQDHRCGGAPDSIEFPSGNRNYQICIILIPYLIVGYDILKKAWKGILNRQVFDENFDGSRHGRCDCDCIL